MADPRTPSPGGSDDLSHKVQEDAQRTAEQARGEAHRRAEQGSDQAASAIEDFADAIRRAQNELGETHHTTAARMVGEAAQGLEQLSRAIARRTPEEMLGDLRGFGRDHPSAFLAGSVLAGMALGRMARSSAHHEHPEHHGDSGRPSAAAATGSSPGAVGAGPAGAATASSGESTRSGGEGAGRGPMPPASGGDTTGPTTGRRAPAGSVQPPSPEGPTPAGPATRKD